MSDIVLSRRGFLLAGAALVMAPVLPAAKAAPALNGFLAADSILPMWAVGSPGEFDWQPIAARTAEEAFALRFDVLEDDPHQLFELVDCVKRVEKWDGREPDNLGKEDWIEAGFGTFCDRCDSECAHEDLWIIDGVICDECLTVEERFSVQPVQAYELLCDEIANDGADEARSKLEASGQFEGIPAGIWEKAVAEVAEAEKP